MQSLTDDVSAMRGDKLYQLCYELRMQYPQFEPAGPNEEFNRRTESQRPRLIAILRELLLQIMAGIAGNENYHILFVNRKIWDNVIFRPELGLRLRPDPLMTVVSGKRLHRAARVIILLLRLLDSGDRATKRDHMYAMELNKQSQVDDIIDDIAATCNISRISLNTISSADGLIFGDVQYTTRSGARFHCVNSGKAPIQILPACTDIMHMTSPAAFVLVVEKDTVFRRLLEHDVPAQLNCILVTGKGYPDLPSRRMVNLMWQFLHVPILALVDGDPHGIDIMCMYRFGSVSAAYDVHSLSCPQMRWCGFLPSDFKDCRRHSQPLEPADIRKLQDLLARPYIAQMPQLRDELVELGAGGYKYGLEEFAVLRADYLSHNYLPFCLSRGRFI